MLTTFCVFFFDSDLKPQTPNPEPQILNPKLQAPEHQEPARGLPTSSGAAPKENCLCPPVFRFGPAGCSGLALLGFRKFRGFGV